MFNLFIFSYWNEIKNSNFFSNEINNNTIRLIFYKIDKIYYKLNHLLQNMKFSLRINIGQIKVILKTFVIIKNYVHIYWLSL